MSGQSFERRPLRRFAFPVFVLVVHGVLLIGTGLSLMRMGASGGLHELSRFAMPLLGCFFFLAGLPLFARVRAVGWILLFLGDLALLFQGCSLLLWNGFTWASLEVVVGMIPFVCALVLLMQRHLYSLYAYPDMRFWERARRYETLLAVEMKYCGREVLGYITDISLTGCSFVVDVEIPIGEVLSCRADLKAEQWMAEIQVLRKASARERVSSDKEMGLYKYGARFRIPLKQHHLTRVLGK